MDQSTENMGVQAVVDQYRQAFEAGDTQTCAALRAAWKEWQGEDSLHEMAFGEP